MFNLTSCLQNNNSSSTCTTSVATNITKKNPQVKEFRTIKDKTNNDFTLSIISSVCTIRNNGQLHEQLIFTRKCTYLQHYYNSYRFFGAVKGKIIVKTVKSDQQHLLTKRQFLLTPVEKLLRVQPSRVSQKSRR